MSRIDDDRAREWVRAHFSTQPEPPTTINADTIFTLGRAQRRQRTRTIAGSSAVIVAVIALASGLALSELGSGSRPAASSANQTLGSPAQPASSARSLSGPAAMAAENLTGSAWRITQLQFDSAVLEPATAPVIFHFGEPARPADDSVLILHEGSCITAGVHVSAERIEFTSPLSDDLLPNCGPNLSVTQQQALESILSGSLRWQITDNKLVLSDGRRGRVEFIREAP